MTETETSKRGRGRPKGAKNKSTLKKLQERTEIISPDTLVSEEKGDMMLPNGGSDAISKLLSSFYRNVQANFILSLAATNPADFCCNLLWLFF